MHPTVAANARHRNDELMGIWTKVDRKTYRNFEGYEIARDHRGWVVYAPSGTRITYKHFVEPNLYTAKGVAESHMAATTLGHHIPDLVGVVGGLEPHAVHEAYTTDDNEHGPCLGFTIDNYPDFDARELIDVIMEVHCDATANLTQPQIDQLRGALDALKIQPHDGDSVTVFFPDVRVQQTRKAIRRQPRTFD